jgi:hypothetical protein
MQDPEQPLSSGERTAPEPAPATTSSTPPEPPEPPTAAQPAPGTTAGRPTGITILAVLAAIAGVFGIFGGLALVIGGSFIGLATGSAGLGSLAAVVGVIWVLAAVLSLVFAWGAWGLKPWAWTLGVGIQAVYIVLGLFQLFNGQGGAIFSIAIAAIITYYLFRPEIQAAFGRS